METKIGFTSEAGIQMGLTDRFHFDLDKDYSSIMIAVDEGEVNFRH